MCREWLRSRRFAPAMTARFLNQHWFCWKMRPAEILTGVGGWARGRKPGPVTSPLLPNFRRNILQAQSKMASRAAPTPKDTCQVSRKPFSHQHYTPQHFCTTAQHWSTRAPCYYLSARKETPRRPASITHFREPRTQRASDEYWGSRRPARRSPHPPLPSPPAHARWRGGGGGGLAASSGIDLALCEASYEGRFKGWWPFCERSEVRIPRSGRSWPALLGPRP